MIKKGLIIMLSILFMCLTSCSKNTEADSDIRHSDDSSGFVLFSEVVPDAILEIRYYSTYNFVGERIDGYEEPIALITKEAGEALKKVSDEGIDAAINRKYLKSTYNKIKEKYIENK